MPPPHISITVMKFSLQIRHRESNNIDTKICPRMCCDNIGGFTAFHRGTAIMKRKGSVNTSSIVLQYSDNREVGYWLTCGSEYRVMCWALH